MILILLGFVNLIFIYKHTQYVSHVYILTDVLKRKYFPANKTNGHLLILQVLPIVQLTVWFYYIIYLYLRKEARAKYNRIPVDILFDILKEYRSKAEKSALIYYSAMILVCTVTLIVEGFNEVNMRFLGYYCILAYLCYGVQHLTPYNLNKNKKKVILILVTLVVIIGSLYIWTKGVYKTIIWLFTQ